jgi:hypothetical protein
MIEAVADNMVVVGDDDYDCYWMYSRVESCSVVEQREMGGGLASPLLLMHVSTYLSFSLPVSLSPLLGCIKKQLTLGMMYCLS